MSAGAVAKPGMAPNTGQRNSASMNITAVVRAVRPVRPPSATPAVAFHIAGDGGGAQAGARHGADGVGHQSAAHAGQLAVLIQQVALVGNADERCPRCRTGQRTGTRTR